MNKKNFNNLRIKFHPILPSCKFNQNFPHEVRGNGSDIISSGYIVVTSSYTSGLYESISNNSFTIMLDCCALDKVLIKDISQYTKKLKLCENLDQICIQLKKVKKNNYKKCKENKLVRKIFFNKK